MNVIIVNDFAYLNGGAAMIAINTAKLLAARGHNVTLFTAVGPIDSSLQNIGGLTVICLNQRDILNDSNRLRAIIQGIWNIKAATVMQKLIMNMAVENTIVHIHTLSKSISSSIIPVIKHKHIKVIYHVHDYGVVCPNLAFFNYQKVKICRMSPLCKECLFCNCDARSFSHKLWRVVRQLVQDRFIQNYIDGYIFVSNFSARILKKYIKNGVVMHAPIYVREAYKIDVSANNAALFIGRLSKEKNVVLLARAAKELDIPVIFIGSGPCENEIRETNPNAILTGWLEQKNMKKYISMARYLVFPSILYETQGLVVLEAAVHGIPSIVSDSCAATDFVVDGENGLWFKNNDIDSLKLAMKNLLDSSLLTKLGENAYKKSKEYMEEGDKYVDRLEKYYERIIEHKKDSGNICKVTN